MATPTKKTAAKKAPAKKATSKASTTPETQKVVLNLDAAAHAKLARLARMERLSVEDYVSWHLLAVPPTQVTD